MTGYELAQFFDQSMGWVWSAPHSQIYPHLHQMETDGLVSVDRQVKGTRLERRVYSITDQGRTELRDWVSQPTKSIAMKDPVLLQAIFYEFVDPEKARAVLRSVIDEQDSIAAKMEAHAEELRRGQTQLLAERLQHRDPRLHQLVAELKGHAFEGGVSAARARAEWARKGIEIIDRYQVALREAEA